MAHNDNPLMTVLIAAVFALIGMNTALIARNIGKGITSNTDAFTGETKDKGREVLEFKEGEEESGVQRKKGVPRSYQVTMNSTWNFPNGSSPSENAYVANDKNNETPIYFDVVLRETGKRIYHSPVLELGDSLRGISLETELTPGLYDCLMQIHLLDDKGETLTTVKMGLRVNIEG